MVTQFADKLLVILFARRTFSDILVRQLVSFNLHTATEEFFDPTALYPDPGVATWLAGPIDFLDNRLKANGENPHGQHHVRELHGRPRSTLPEVGFEHNRASVPV